MFSTHFNVCLLKYSNQYKHFSIFLYSSNLQTHWLFFSCENTEYYIIFDVKSNLVYPWKNNGVHTFHGTMNFSSIFSSEITIFVCNIHYFLITLHILWRILHHTNGHHLHIEYIHFLSWHCFNDLSNTESYKVTILFQIKPPLHKCTCTVCHFNFIFRFF